MGNESEISQDLVDKFEEHRQRGSSGTLVVSDDEVYVGDTITLEGRNLPANVPLDVVWQTARGHWGVLQGNDVVGPQYQHDSRRLTTVSTDENGAVSESLTVPEDYGGDHTIELQTADEESLAETTVTITPWFELEESSVPLGETFTLTGYGIGPDYLTSLYPVVWDNSMVGFLTGVMNNGTGTAEIRAVGPVGEHVIQVWRNFHGTPFLQNNTQSPFGQVAGGRQSAWTVEVTEPEREFPTQWMDSLVQESPLDSHMISTDVDSEATLSITPTSGQPGTDAFISGEQFPSDTEVNLVWHAHEGHHIKGIPVSPEPRPEVLPTVQTDDSGQFRQEVTIPSDIGSTRPLTAEIDGTVVASTGFVLQPEIKQMTPTEGPVGTEIEFEFRSLGWTMYDTAYFFVWDNKRVGYICGSDHDEGVTRTVLRATGEPGTHFIDVYPGYFKMEEDKPDFTLKPHLSYRQNHAVRPLPAFHFTFEVTE